MKDETIIVILVVAWLVFGMVVPLPNEDPPPYYPPTNPPGRELFMRDSDHEIVEYHEGIVVEHYSLRP